jgi:hypothetical protein
MTRRNLSLPAPIDDSFFTRCSKSELIVSRYRRENEMLTPK